MKNRFIVFLSLLALASCASQKDLSKANPTEFASSITSEELKQHLYTFASDEFLGRETGEPGQKKAAKYLKTEYMSLNIPALLGDENYYQEIPSSYFKNRFGDTENVVAFIKGRDYDSKQHEYLVISAHYDHEGVDEQGNIYNGADDDGSGTVAILEIAEAFKIAVEEGYRPKRSIIFMHFTGEEKGLLGSKYYTENPIVPLEETITNLNIDMVGRVDAKHKNNPNYVYLIGSDMLSTELHELSEQANEKYVHLNLDYTYNGTDDPNRFYYRSDHYNFAKHGIPVIFYFNGVHEDYHKPTDTPDKINYDLLEKRAKLIFYTAWKVANGEHAPVVDKPVK
ncbi:MAG TPA: M28 family metallopeptidase [Flavobacteriaceae bacterium]|nr:M28 family metallopeptidase [Flavobacteriaceae bacterium]